MILLHFPFFWRILLYFRRNDCGNNKRRPLWEIYKIINATHIYKTHLFFQLYYSTNNLDFCYLRIIPPLSAHTVALFHTFSNATTAKQDLLSKTHSCLLQFQQHNYIHHIKVTTTIFLAAEYHQILPHNFATLQVLPAPLTFLHYVALCCLLCCAPVGLRVQRGH